MQRVIANPRGRPLPFKQERKVGGGQHGAADNGYAAIPDNPLTDRFEQGVEAEQVAGKDQKHAEQIGRDAETEAEHAEHQERQAMYRPPRRSAGLLGGRRAGRLGANAVRQRRSAPKRSDCRIGIVMHEKRPSYASQC